MTSRPPASTDSAVTPGPARRRRRPAPAAAPRSSRGTRPARRAERRTCGCSPSSSPPAWCRRCRPRPASPAWMHPVGHLVVRGGAVGTGADDDEVDASRGPRRRSPRRCRRRPRARCGRGAATPPSGRARGRSPGPASRRAPTSAGVLRIRSARRTAPAGTLLAPGIAARSRSTCSAHIRLATPTSPAGRRAGDDQRVRVLGLVPGRRSIRAAGRRGLGRGNARAAGRPANGSPRPADQAGQPLQRLARRSRSASAGPGPGVRSRARCPRSAAALLGVSVRCDRGSDDGRCHGPLWTYAGSRRATGAVWQARPAK